MIKLGGKEGKIHINLTLKKMVFWCVYDLQVEGDGWIIIVGREAELSFEGAVCN